MDEHKIQDNSMVTQIMAKEDAHVLYLFRRASRISYAIYIVSELIKDSEPLKWSMRKVASEMLSFRAIMGASDSALVLEKSLVELGLILDLALFAHVTGEMNTKIIKNEIEKLLQEIRPDSNSSAEHRTLDAMFFSVSKPEIVSSFVIQKTEIDVNNSKGHKGQAQINNVLNTMRKASTPKQAVPVASEPKANDRRAQILAVIKSKGVVNIKDIVDKVTDCSEKTIQRELIALVAEGVLKKTGERRWSTYALA